MRLIIEILYIAVILVVLYPVLPIDRFIVTTVLLVVLYIQSNYYSYVVGYRAAEKDRIF